MNSMNNNNDNESRLNELVNQPANSASEVSNGMNLLNRSSVSLPDISQWSEFDDMFWESPIRPNMSLSELNSPVSDSSDFWSDVTPLFVERYKGVDIVLVDTVERANVAFNTYRTTLNILDTNFDEEKIYICDYVTVVCKKNFNNGDLILKKMLDRLLAYDQDVDLYRVVVIANKYFDSNDLRTIDFKGVQYTANFSPELLLINTIPDVGTYTKFGSKARVMSALSKVEMYKENVKTTVYVNIRMNCNIGSVVHNFLVPGTVDGYDYINFHFTMYGHETVTHGEHEYNICKPESLLMDVSLSSKEKQRRFFLVGIELNPGPSNQLLLYLKNQDKFSGVVECIKRRQHHGINKLIVSQEKKENKKKTQKKNKNINEKKNKNMMYLEPESLFNVGLEEQDKLFLSTIVSQFRNVMKDGSTVKIEPFNSVSDVVTQLLTFLSGKGEMVRDVVFVTIGYLADTFGGFWVFMVDCISMIKGYLKPEGLADISYAVYMMKQTVLDQICDLDVFGLMNTISKVSEKADKLEVFFDKVFSFVIPILNNILMKSGIEYRLPYTFSEDEVLNSFYEKLHDLREDVRLARSSDYVLSLKVFSLQDQLETMVMKGLYTNKLKDKLNYLLRELKPLVTLVETTVNPNNGPRVEPLGLLIAGPSGVGKSSITMPLLLSLLSEVVPKENFEAFEQNHNDFIFFRANENEFFDGYKRNHLAVVYDDFGQLRDVPGATNPDAFEIIRFINTSPYQLHYSSITEKSKNYAAPKIIMATTNRSALQFKSIYSNAAVVRRFNVSVVQVPKKEFCVDPECDNIFDRQMDEVKVRNVFPYDEKDPQTYISLDVIEFFPWDFVSGTATGDPMSFDELRQMCVSKLRYLDNKGDHMLRFHKSIKNKYKPEGYVEDVKNVLDDIDFDAFYNKTDLKHFSAFCVTVGCCISMWALLKRFGASVGENGSSSAGNNPKTGDKKKTLPNKVKLSGKEKKTMRIRLARDRKYGHLPEAANLADMDLITRLLKRNVYRFRVKDACLGFVTFIGGSTFIMPRHFDDMVFGHFSEDEDVVVDFVNVFNDTISFRMDWCGEHLSIEDEDEDWLVLKITSSICRDHADLTKFFLKEKEVQEGDKIQCVTSVIRDSKLVFFSPVVHIIGDANKYYAGDKQYVSSKLRYSMPSKAGDCGCLLVTADGRFNSPKIVAMHTAGTPNTFGRMVSKQCTGVFISRELIDEANEKLSNTNVIDDELMVTEANFEGFTQLRKEKNSTFVGKTKIIESPFFGELWDTTTLPAVTRPKYVDGVLVDPSVLARKVYRHDEPFVDIVKLDMVSSVLKPLILNDTTDSPWLPRLFTFEESVKGIDGVDFCEALNRSSSSGYPFTLDPRKRQKTYYLGKDGQVDFDSSHMLELRKIVDKHIEDMNFNKRPAFVFDDKLKDERRPIAKVEACKTRQYSAAPIDLVILTKMYFGDFIRSICQNRIYNGMGLGINPYAEWELLADELNYKENVFTAGDYSGYDGKIPVSVGWRFLDIVELFYCGNENDKRVRRLLFHEIINSVHVHNGVVYEWVGGNSSGNALTSVYNSVCNMLMLGVAICDDVDSVTLCEDRLKFVKFVVFGDDNIIGYPRELSDFCKQSKIADNLWKHFGMKYTIETKDDRDVETRDITQIEFLKRSFSNLRGAIVAPLRLEVLLETLSWCKVPYVQRELELRVEATLSELALHGESVFDKHASIILKASKKHLKFTPVNNSFESALTSSWGLSVPN